MNVYANAPTAPVIESGSTTLENDRSGLAPRSRAFSEDRVPGVQPHEVAREERDDDEQQCEVPSAAQPERDEIGRRIGGDDADQRGQRAEAERLPRDRAIGGVGDRVGV